MSLNLSTAAKVSVLSNAVAAGTSDVNSSSVDMQGFNGCMFVTQFGAITATAVTSVKIQTSDDDSTWNDLAGTAITVADTDDNDVTLHSVEKPLERYLRVVVDRGTANAVVESILGIQYDADVKAVTQPATVIGNEVHVTPAEGTA